MITRILTILLALVCIGLAVALIVNRKNAVQQQREDSDKIGALSNNLFETSTRLEQQRNSSAAFEQDLQRSRQAYLDLSNSLTQMSTTLAQANSTIAKTEATLKATEEEVKKRDSKITELEGQNEALDKQANDLSASLTNLTAQISETQRKLAASEGDKAFLQKELKRLMAEKAELERQFNDIAVLRAQVTRLKEELSVARRIEWIRQGIFSSGDLKGSQRLMQGLTPALGRPKTPPGPADLNVELGSDRSPRVIVTTNSAAGRTNSPPQ